MAFCEKVLRCAHCGQAELFDRLAAFVETSERQSPFRQLAARTGQSEVALHLQVFRLRQKFRALLMAKVFQTVATPEELEALRKWFAGCWRRGDGEVWFSYRATDEWARSRAAVS